MKTVIRPMPYEISQFHETEDWLTRKAAEGLHFRDCMLGFASLTRGEPKAVRYRLEFSHGFREPGAEQRALYADMGWEYVTAIRGDYFVFRTEDPDAPELHTEDAPIQQEKKNIFWRQLWPFLFVPAISWRSGPEWLGMLWKYGFAYCVLQYSSAGLLLTLLGLLTILWAMLRSLRLAIQYKRGVVGKRTRFPLPLLLTGTLVLLAGCLISGIFLHHYSSRDDRAPEALSFPTLKQIDEDAYDKLLAFRDIQRDPDRLSAHLYTGRDFDCYDQYTHRDDLLVAPEELRQQLTTYPSEDGRASPDYSVYYRVQLYRCLTAGLAEDLAETLLSPPEGDRPNWSLLSHDGAATVYTCVEEWNSGELYQRLLLTDGRRVMTVTYQGEQDILAFLPAYEAALTE